LVFLRATLVYHNDMTSLPSRNPITFDRPAIYRINVQGRIDSTWSDSLEGMTIDATTVEGEPPVTTLEGELSDQAALAGVLNTLYELHLPVLSVKLIKKDINRTSQGGIIPKQTITATE
jgi:hypothetical protein